MKLRDKVALITGAGTGIGRGIAEAFAREGANVVLAGRRLNLLQEVAGQIEQSGARALPFQADVCLENDIQGLLAATLKEFGRLDILVNNAGMFFSGSMADTSLADWDNVFTLNARSVFLLSRAVLPELEKTRGQIINISSTLGELVIPACTAYSASKAALNMMSKSMAFDYAAKGIRINVISPGVVDTPIHSYDISREEWEAQMLAMHPLGRIGQPLDVAGAAVFLAGDEASWITGVNLQVGGGIHLT